MIIIIITIVVDVAFCWYTSEIIIVIIIIIIIVIVISRYKSFGFLYFSSPACLLNSSFSQQNHDIARCKAACSSIRSGEHKQHKQTGNCIRFVRL